MNRKQQGTKKGPRMIKEILRLRGMGLSKRRIALALRCSRSTVDKYLGAPVAPDVSSSTYRAPWSESVDWAGIRSETERGFALQHVWETSERLRQIPFTSFWREYRRRFPSIPLEFHKIHPPGERCEADFKGQDSGFGYVDIQTSKFVACRLFGATLCFSQIFFARASTNERQEDWLRGIAAAYEYFRGVPQTTAVDNAKALVARADRYDPDINREFAHFCESFGTAPLACRPGKPKDKSLIENSLGVFWRWIRPQLAMRTFYSLGDLNMALKDLIDLFNARPQRKYGLSRRSKFEHGERERLLPLPAAPYSPATWRSAKAHPDCHIQVDYNFYSVPYQLRGTEVEVRVSGSCVEVFHNLSLVAVHFRLTGGMRGRYATKKEHLPDQHKAMLEATPRRVLEDALRIGPATHATIHRLLSDSTHPLMFLRRAQGVLRLAKRYTPDALDAACQAMNRISSTGDVRLRDIEGIIKSNLNQQSVEPIAIRRGANRFLRGQTTWTTGSSSK